MRVLPIDGVLTVHIPNSFTPNGDGVNDVFAPVVRDAVPGSYRLTIFDRWGQEQFTSTDTALGWDGNIGGTAAKQDVYVWRLEVLGVRNTETQERIGHVTLLR
jgi:gliding motility-associated-like protein